MVCILSCSCPMRTWPVNEIWDCECNGDLGIKDLLAKFDNKLWFHMSVFQVILVTMALLKWEPTCCCPWDPLFTTCCNIGAIEQWDTVERCGWWKFGQRRCWEGQWGSCAMHAAWTWKVNREGGDVTIASWINVMKIERYDTEPMVGMHERRFTLDQSYKF